MVDEFKKMEYTEEQCQELEKLSAFGDSMHDIDVHDAEKMLSDAMKKYHLDKDEVDRIIDEANKTKLEKENITMGITCKPVSKMQSIMCKMENQLEAERKAAKEKKEAKKSKR